MRWKKAGSNQLIKTCRYKVRGAVSWVGKTAPINGDLSARNLLFNSFLSLKTDTSTLCKPSRFSRIIKNHD
jgi:hypothetical protein